MPNLPDVPRGKLDPLTIPFRREDSGEKALASEEAPHSTASLSAASHLGAHLRHYFKAGSHTQHRVRLSAHALARPALYLQRRKRGPVRNTVLHGTRLSSIVRSARDLLLEDIAENSYQQQDAEENEQSYHPGDTQNIRDSSDTDVVDHDPDEPGHDTADTASLSGQYWMSNELHKHRQENLSKCFMDFHQKMLMHRAWGKGRAV
jgi:hypothetical protein